MYNKVIHFLFGPSFTNNFIYKKFNFYTTNLQNYFNSNTQSKLHNKY